MSLLKINLLGVLEATLDSAPLTHFRSQKERALLAYLALEGARPLSRESLATLLWPNYTTQKSLTNLRNSLSRLRKVWRSATTAEADTPSFLLVTRQSVQLNPDSQIETDVAQFEALCKQIKQHGHQDYQLCTECEQAAVALAQLYQGDFLQGFSLPDSPDFDDWRLSKQEQYHQMAMGVLDQLTAVFTARKEFKQVQRFTQQQLQRQPWHETAHRRLMQAFTLTGQREAALQQYALCQQILAEEMGLEPEPATVELFEQLRQGRPISLEDTPSLKHNLPSAMTGFVGRDAELKQLLTKLTQPDCRLLTLVSPGGMGKTRLAIQAAWQLVKDNTPHFEDGIFFVPLAEITELDTAVNTIGAALGLEFQGSEPAVRQLGQALQPQQCLLILDNLEQLAAVWDSITQLLQAAPKISILATSRSRLNLRSEWVLQLRGLPVPAKIDQVKALNATALSLFAQRAKQANAHFALAKLPEGELAAVQRICQLVDGMPLALELAGQWVQVLSCVEIAHEITNSLEFLESTFYDLPPRQRSINVILQYTWKQLTLQEQQTLSNLTVFVGSFDRRAAHRVAGANLPILMRLVEKSLIKRNSTQRFELHPLIRQFMRTTITYERPHQEHCEHYLTYVSEKGVLLNQNGHEEVLNDLLPDIDNIRHAWHWAVENGQWPLIQAAVSDLATSYFALYWLEEALILFEKTILKAQQSEITAQFSQAQKTQLQHQLSLIVGRLCVMLAKWETAIAHLRQLLEDDDSDYEIRANAYYWMARSYEQMGAHANALEWIRAGELFFGESKHPKAAELLLIKILILIRRGESVGLLPKLVNLINTYQTNTDTVLDNFSHDSANSTQPYDKNVLARAYTLQGIIYRMQSDTAKAIKSCQKALALYERTNNLSGQGSASNELANIYFSIGRWTQAYKAYKQAHTLFEQTGDIYHVALVNNNLGGISGNQGRLNEAINYYHSALHAINQIGGSLWMLGAFHMNLGGILVKKGSIKQAREHLNQSLGYFKEVRNRDFMPELQRYFAEATLTAGNLDEAKQEIEQALKWAEELNMPVEQGNSLRILGEIAYKQQQWVVAERYLTESVTKLRQAGESYNEARSHLTFAHLYAVQGLTDQMESEIELCEDVFKDLGAALDLEKIVQLRTNK